MHEIAARHGVIEASVYRWIRQAQLRRPADPARRPDKTTLRRLYIDRRMSVREVGEQFQVSGTTAYGWLVSAGIPMRQPGGSDVPIRPDADQLWEMYVHQRLSLPEAARSPVFACRRLPG